ncbi:MAG TPA: hypothetical protein VH418_05495 [Solirubrobacteraceae bacterium]|jgi:hypothetical protein
MIRRLFTAYSTWQQRSHDRALHFHAGPRGAYACTDYLCGKWSISGDDAARIGFE